MVDERKTSELLESMLKDRLQQIGDGKKARRGMDHEAEKHQECQYPVEIADVQSTIKRRMPLLVSAIGLISVFLTSIVVVSMYAATTRSDVNHLQSREVEDRATATKDRETSEAEDRAIRATISENERRNAESRERLIETTSKIEMHLKVLSESENRRRR